MRPHARTMYALAAACVLAAALTACVAAPQLRLPPASLGVTLARQQKLTVTAAGRTFTLDAVLEADADGVRLAVLQFGMPVARLDWDGTTLSASHAPQWPASLPVERVLSDLQLVLWPADAIRAALPQGWRLREDGSVRELLRGDVPEIRVETLSPTLSRLSQLRLGYRIDIDSRPMEQP